MNKYSAVQWSPGGTTVIVNKGPTCTDRGPKCAGTVPPPQDFHFNHCAASRLSVCPSVHLSVTSWSHRLRNTSKRISGLVSLACSIFADPNIVDLLPPKGTSETGMKSRSRRLGFETVSRPDFDCLGLVSTKISNVSVSSRSRALISSRLQDDV